MSALFAATYPDRVTALILFGSYASGNGWRARAGAQTQRMFDLMIENWGQGFGLELFAPSLVTPDRTRRFGAFERTVGSPGMVRGRLDTVLALDVAEALPAIRAPTLVLHRTNDRAVPIAIAREMADAIPDARFVEVPGDEHIPWVGDTEQILVEVEEFLTGTRHPHDTDRVLATVLFTDIVDSTRHAAELGDRRWRELLESHDALVREHIESYRGREVKTTGDGFLATFDGPARAIHCARSIASDVATLGLDVRCGLHTGELELTDHDVAGMAVNIGARVLANAGAGEVVVSSTVKDLVVGSGIEFADRGIHALKGVPGDWRLFAVANDV